MPSCTVIPELVYDDVLEAIDWLRATFGLAERWRAGDHRAQPRSAAARWRSPSPARRGRLPGTCRWSSAWPTRRRTATAPANGGRASSRSRRTSRTASASTPPRTSAATIGRSRSRSPTWHQRSGAVPRGRRCTPGRRRTDPAGRIRGRLGHADRPRRGRGGPLVPGRAGRGADVGFGWGRRPARCRRPVLPARGHPAHPTETSPDRAGLTSVRIELFVDDPDALVARAIDAGATAGSPVVDHEMPWGTHRQGGFLYPFGHNWSVGDRSPLRTCE